MYSALSFIYFICCVFCLFILFLRSVCYKNHGEYITCGLNENTVNNAVIVSTKIMEYNL